VVSHATLEPGRYVRLSVEDSGCGHRRRRSRASSSRSFTTGHRQVRPRPVAGYAIVTDSRASDVKRRARARQHVAIYLPLVEIAPADAAEAGDPLPRGHGERVLIVDDDEPLLAVTADCSPARVRGDVLLDSRKALAAFEAAPGNSSRRHRRGDPGSPDGTRRARCAATARLPIVLVTATAARS